MMTGSSSCFPTTPQGLHMCAVSNQEDVEAASATAAASESHSSNFLYNVSLLKDKIHQVQSLANFFISPDQNHQPSESTAIAIASIGTLIQEIIVTATSVMYTCQQMALGVGSPSGNNNNNNSNSNFTEDLNLPGSRVAKHLDPGSLAQSFDVNRVGDSRFVQEERGHGFYGSESLDWFASDSYNATYTTRNSSVTHFSNKNSCGGARDLRNSSVTHVSNYKNKDIAKRDLSSKGENTEGLEQLSPKNYDIVELDAADILAKYTHYCQVCGKGFKRDANLRMHMRAHGDEYKSSAALSNPMKNNAVGGEEGKEAAILQRARKYSCPQEGCRWNKKHAKFQPLKSMICVKNHYKRSHCPKMYVCKRCNRKQFSVLSDLRTHEKHCGDLKWQCSCGTTFSRKDKLMGHVALFVGHTPAISSLAKMGKVDPSAVQIQLED